MIGRHVPCRPRGPLAASVRAGAVALVWCLGALSTASAQSTSRPRATGGRTADRPTMARMSSTDSAAAALVAEEQRRAIQTLERTRRALLARAGWADLGDRCNPGALRVFPRDTSVEARDSVTALVETMERLIVVHGVGGSLESPAVAALVRTVVGWEAGIDRPVWDADESGAPRQAVAAGLTGETADPMSSACLPSPVARDTVLFVIPGVKDMPFPNAPRPRVMAYFGADGQRHARDEFVARVGRADPAAALSYVLVAPIVTFRDWAVVAVRRPVEQGGVALDGRSQGGATYLFRRVGGVWRLLAIVRSWGA